MSKICCICNTDDDSNVLRQCHCSGEKYFHHICLLNSKVENEHYNVCSKIALTEADNKIIRHKIFYKNFAEKKYLSILLGIILIIGQIGTVTIYYKSYIDYYTKE